MATEIGVVVVHRQRLVAQTLAEALDEHGSLRTVGTATHLRDASDVVLRLQPDVVVVEAAVLEPTLAGLIEWGRLSPDTRVLAFGASFDADRAERLLVAGVTGLWLEASSFEALAGAVRHTGRGGVVLHPDVAGLVVGNLVGYATGLRHPGPLLSGRQLEVLALMAQGLSNREIAGRLRVGPETVKSHVSQVLDRLGASTRTEAVSTGLRLGLLHPLHA